LNRSAITSLVSISPASMYYDMLKPLMQSLDLGIAELGSPDFSQYLAGMRIASTYESR
jgi:hypothetical protein